ncbi:MAG TPA: site-2 protease family protein [Gemmatimonadaceae bacterium]
MNERSLALRDVSKCASCATELAPHALSCPACQTLVYSDKLKDLAAQAERLAGGNDLTGARDAWTEALRFLPAETQQHEAVLAHVTALNASIAQQASAMSKPETTGSGWKRGAAGAATVVVLLLSKLKFLILGLTKASTFLSMFAFFGVYWTSFGWPLALGLVVSIYIHEMGHVAELKRLGIEAGAPMFIPGVGAFVRLRQHVTDAVTDARIGLAGPIWGLGAGVAAWLVGSVTASQTWFAIAQLTGYINLFNLIPVWQLDGSRGFHALDRAARWGIVALTILTFVVTRQRLLLVIAAVGAFRAFQQPSAKTDRRTLLTFAGLVVLLSLLAEIPVAK